MAFYQRGTRVARLSVPLLLVGCIASAGSGAGGQADSARSSGAASPSAAAAQPSTSSAVPTATSASSAASPSRASTPSAQQASADLEAAAEPALGCESETGLQVLSHDIDLDVSLEPPSIVGQGRLRVKATKATSWIVLDAKDLAVSRFLVGSSEVSFEQTSDRICAKLSNPLAAGSERTLRLEWRVNTRGRMPAFFKTQVYAGYETSAWMPTRQDAAQRATLALHVTASNKLRVGASGRLLEAESLPDERVRHHFVLDLPSPPFLYAFAAGNFEVAEHRSEDTLLRAYGPRGPGLGGALQATGSMYQFLSSKLGVGHPWGEYLQVFVEGDIAQEAAGMALIGAQALKDRSIDPEDDWVFMHELAHQWFGWLVPCADFSDFWLNEGLSTFTVGAFKESQWGAAAYEREVDNWRQRSAKVRAAGREAPIALSSPTGAARPAPRDFELQDRGVTYFRGALVLHRLRTELGEEAFWRGLRLYVTTHAGKGARTRDLESALERASGRDLGKFFEQYVYAAAEP